MDIPPISTPSANGRHRFRLLDLTLPSPVENIALDEVLLDQMEEHGGEPLLRFWESDRCFVVLGRSSRAGDDVHVAACERDGVEILRRISGGGTVLQGPGCLSYALVARQDLHPDLESIRTTNRFVLDRIASVIRRWEPDTVFCGISDLAVGERKISGNAQRRTRRSLLFHGTLLHGMDGALIARYLKQPARQPNYRQDRPHEDFVRTIDAKPDDLKQAMALVWHAVLPSVEWTESRLQAGIRNVLERSRR
ncbi:Biotin/lipoate A/B protein ligase [Nitrospira japonica]|uniref:Biotin/lipoate A/B protein ligase n=1 Tax=Nitrospira japonica TaxID=1325564 RepID=A0A1W1I8Q9_9BACT|nr:lipoate--protein ligase family protein [Nitrospira japonica]SLM49396.1 Biotin/lipoate A/B protein ligase [Nitrospira japonica]